MSWISVCAEIPSSFDLNVVLTPEHPLYKKPSPQEQYCMRRAKCNSDQGESLGREASGRCYRRN